MKDYLSTLNEREKTLLMAGLICLFFYTYYLLLYAPLNRTLVQKKSQLIEKTQTLAWMKEQSPSAISKRQKISNSQLLTLLARQLKNKFRFPYQLQQTGSGDLQLSFEAVPFNLFLSWLAELNKEYNIEVKQFEAQSSKTAGVTKLMLILSAIER